MAQWTHPQCERCWIDEQGDWHEVAEGIHELRSVRFPVRVKIEEVNRCCTCGEATISGIFVRKNPADIPFPAPEDD